MSELLELGQAVLELAAATYVYDVPLTVWAYGTMAVSATCAAGVILWRIR